MPAGWRRGDGGLAAGRRPTGALGWCWGSGFHGPIVTLIVGFVTDGCPPAWVAGLRRGSRADGLVIALMGGVVAEGWRRGRSGVAAGCHPAGDAGSLPGRGPDGLLVARIGDGVAFGQRPARAARCRRGSCPDGLLMAEILAGVAMQHRGGGGGIWAAGWLRGSLDELIVMWIGRAVVAVCRPGGAVGWRRGSGPDALRGAPMGGEIEAACRPTARHSGGGAAVAMGRVVAVWQRPRYDAMWHRCGGMVSARRRWAGGGESARRAAQ